MDVTVFEAKKWCASLTSAHAGGNEKNLLNVLDQMLERTIRPPVFRMAKLPNIVYLIEHTTEYSEALRDKATAVDRRYQRSTRFLAPLPSKKSDQTITNTASTTGAGFFFCRFAARCMFVCKRCIT
jgi:hypothetical protein